MDGLHLLAALVQQDGGTASPLLRAVGADPADVLKKTRDQISRLPRAAGATVSAPETSRQLLAALATAGKLARDMSDEYVSTEHLLVGLATDGGQAATVLRDAGAGPKQLTDAFEQVRGHARVTSQDPEGTYQALEKYGIDLTQSARDGKLDPVIGRDAGDPPGDPGAVPAHQEQPGPDRRAWRRQDRRRRGPGPARRRRRRARVAARQARRRARPRRDGRRR